MASPIILIKQKEVTSCSIPLDKFTLSSEIEIEDCALPGISTRYRFGDDDLSPLLSAGRKVNDNTTTFELPMSSRVKSSSTARMLVSPAEVFDSLNLFDGGPLSEYKRGKGTEFVLVKLVISTKERPALGYGHPSRHQYATLLIEPPTTFTGGDLIINHKVVPPAAKGDVRITAFFSGYQHSVTPVKSGSGLVIVFAAYVTGDEETRTMDYPLTCKVRKLSDSSLSDDDDDDSEASSRIDSPL